MSIYSVNILFRLSVGNVTKGFATYGCFHPCFIYLEPGSSTSPPDGISCYMCGYMVMDNGQPQQISDDIPLCSEGVSYSSFNISSYVHFGNIYYSVFVPYNITHGAIAL